MGLKLHGLAPDQAVDTHIRAALRHAPDLGGQAGAIGGGEGHLVRTKEHLDSAVRRTRRRRGLPVGNP